MSGTLVVDPLVLTALRESLDDVVRLHPQLLPAVERVLTPLDVLHHLGSLCVDALGPRWADRARFRLTLGGTTVREAALHPTGSLSSPDGPTPPVEDGGIAAERSVLGHVAGGSFEAALADGGLLRIGGLLALTVAACRSGEDLEQRAWLVHRVQALAMVALPAAVLSQAVRNLASVDDLARMLIPLADPWGSLADVTEVDRDVAARWLLVRRLIAALGRIGSAMPWDGTHHHTLVRLDSSSACAGDAVLFHLAGEELPSDKAWLASQAQEQSRLLTLLKDHAPEPGDASDTWRGMPLTDLLDACQRGRSRWTVRELVARAKEGWLATAFASDSAAVGLAPADLAEEASLDGRATASLLSTVPEGTRAGWVGLHDAAIAELSRRSRSALAQALAALDDLLPERERTGEIVLLTLADAQTGDPPRSGTARFDGGGPAIRRFETLGEAVPDGIVRLRWEVEGATEVRLQGAMGSRSLPPSGRTTETVPSAPALSLTLSASGCGIDVASTITVPVSLRIVGLRLSPDGGQLVVQVRPEGATGVARVRLGQIVREAPLTDGVARIDLPAEGLSWPARIEVGRDANRVDDHRVLDEAPETATAPTTRRLVVLRPAVVEPAAARPLATRVDLQQVRATLRRLSTAERAWQLLPAPVVDDAVVTLDGRLVDGHDSRIPALLAHLDHLAATHPGLEDAAFVALVPPTEQHLAVSVRVPGNAACLLAVATLDALPGLLDGSLPTPEPAQRRMRLLGTVHADGRVTLTDTRAETRGAGPGGAFGSDVQVQTMTRDGHSLTTTPLPLVSASLPAPFSLLLPLPARAVRVELGSPVLGRLARVLSVGEAPGVGASALPAAGAPWSLTTTFQGARRLTATLEVRRPDGSTWPITSVRPCGPHTWSLHDPDAIGQGLLGAGPDGQAQLGVVVTDGWNLARLERAGQDLDLEPPPAGPRVVVRSGPGQTVWVDHDDSLDAVAAGVIWEVDGIDEPAVDAEDWVRQTRGRTLSARLAPPRLL